MHLAQHRRLQRTTNPAPPPLACDGCQLLAHNTGGSYVPAGLAEPGDAAIARTKQYQMMRAADPRKRLVPQVITADLPADRPGLQAAERYVGEQFGEHGQQVDEHIAGHPARVPLPGQSLSGGPILPLSEARPVEVSEDRSLFHRAMLLDATDMLDEGMPRLSR